MDDGWPRSRNPSTPLAALRAEGVTALVTTPHLLLPRLATDAAWIASCWSTAGPSTSSPRARSSNRPAADRSARNLGPGCRADPPVVPSQGCTVRPRAYLLVEFGFDLQGTHQAVVREALGAGRRIVITRASALGLYLRSRATGAGAGTLAGGARLQVDAGSFNSHYKQYPGAERLAWQTSRARLVVLVSTDRHSMHHVGVSLLESIGASGRPRQQRFAEQSFSGPGTKSLGPT